jgi:hypothetical protein
MGLDDTGRIDIYKDAVKSFLKYPVFGVGWYPSGADWLSAIGEDPYKVLPERGVPKRFPAQHYLSVWCKPLP